MKDYKYAEVYRGAPTDCKPTMKDWYVYYSFKNPATGKFERFIIKDGINRLDNIKDRTEKAKSMIRDIDRALDEGFNPFQNRSERSFMSMETALKFAISKKRWSKESADIHAGTIRIFKNALGQNLSKDVSKFSRTDAREVLDLMVNTQGVGDKSWNRWRTTLHGIFQELVEWEKIPINPFDFKNRRVVKSDAPRLATPDEAKRIKDQLLEHCPGLYVWLMTMNMTAIRPSEILKIKAESIEIITYEEKGIEKEMWYILLQAKDVKDREARKVVVPLQLRQYLKPHIIKGHYLFGDQCQPQIRTVAKSYKSVYHYWTKWIVEDLGLKGIKPYSFKHLGIKTMLATMSYKAVQYQAGHSTSSMTDIYSGKDATIFRDELEKFEGNL